MQHIGLSNCESRNPRTSLVRELADLREVEQSALAEMLEAARLLEENNDDPNALCLWLCQKRWESAVSDLTQRLEAFVHERALTYRLRK